MADKRGRGRVTSDASLRATRRYQTNLEQSEQRFKAITESAPVAIGVVSKPKGTILFTNDVFKMLFGYTTDELMGRKAPDLYVDATDRKRLLKMLRVKGSVEDFEVQLKRKDGTTFWGLASASPVTFGGHDANLHAFIDITGRKRAEESLAETRDYLEKLISYANAPIIVWGPDTRITRFNGAFEKLAGYGAEEVLGRRLELLFPEDSKESSLREIERTAMGGHWETIEIPILRKDGATRIALWNSANIYDKDGRTVISTIAQGQDITERKKAEQALHKARERNSQQEKLAAIGRLAGGVAHELRNPLAAMKNAAYYLNMTVDRSDPMVLETLAVIDREIARSDSIITSLLGLARPAQPSRREVDVGALVEAVLEHQPRPPGVSLETRLDGTLPRVTADPAQLSIALGNIVRNGYEAIPGEGTLSVSSSAEGGWVVVEVADSGTGMSPEVLGRLFEPLYTTKPGGTGLGLSVAKMLVEGSGGRIDVRSEPGRGSVFTVRLPVKGREGR